MDIHEYQAKEILAKFGVTVPAGALAYSPEQAAYRARELGGDRRIVKAQVHAAGGGNYQSLINAALAEHIRRRKEPLEEILRRVIREELRGTTAKTRQAAQHSRGV